MKHSEQVSVYDPFSLLTLEFISLMAVFIGWADNEVLSPLASNTHYIGPTEPETNNDDAVECNTIFYSLVSACGACQGKTWIKYVFPLSRCDLTLI